MSDINLLVYVSALFTAGIFCLGTSALAIYKGYSMKYWFFAGGILGLVILAFLPFTNKGNLTEVEMREKTKSV